MIASFDLGHSHLHGQKAQGKFLRENHPSKDGKEHAGERNWPVSSVRDSSKSLLGKELVTICMVNRAFVQEDPGPRSLNPTSWGSLQQEQVTASLQLWKWFCM